MNQRTRHTIHPILSAMLLLTGLTLLSGCATHSKTLDAPPVAFVDTMTIPVEYELAWKMTRDALLAQEGVEIYTRDKRGLFVAYTEMHREKILYPKRTMLTFTLESASKTSTKISVETVSQRYGVTPLTYPGWRDEDTVSGGNVGREILESIQAMITEI